MGGIPVTITDKGVPVSLQGDIPASSIPFGSPGDPAGPLGPDGRIPSSQLPPLEHDIARAATEAEMLALAVTSPAICIRTDFTPPHVFYLVADPGTNLANWEDTGEFGASTANPTATVGLTAKNGTADTIMRSDAAPALDQSIVPTWTGAHTFTQTLAVLPAGGNGIAVAGTNASGVPSIAAEGAASDISIEIKPKGSAGITLGGATTVSGALTAGSFSTSGTATIGLLSVSGTATFGGNVNVAGNLGSAANTSPPSATNSGISLGGAPTWAMASFYDQALTANNRTADLLFISNSIKFRFVNDARNAFTDVFSINGGQALGVTGITSTSGSGSWTHTGTHTVVQPNDVYKTWLAKSVSADTQNAPTAIGAASTYLQIGGREWKVNGFGGIGFGYVTGTNVNPPVWVGWEEKVTSSFTNGDFLIATRSTNTNVAPTERLRVTAAGDLVTPSGYAPATAQSLATKAYVDSHLPMVVASDGKASQAVNINSPTFYTVPASGMYRVSAYIVISQAATTSSTMPSVSVNYTEATSGAAVQDMIINTASLNQVGAHNGGSAVISAQQGSNIGYITAGYASSGATPMQYAVHMKVEFLG